MCSEYELWFWLVILQLIGVMVDPLKIFWVLTNSTYLGKDETHTRPRTKPNTSIRMYDLIALDTYQLQTETVGFSAVLKRIIKRCSNWMGKFYKHTSRTWKWKAVAWKASWLSRSIPSIATIRRRGLCISIFSKSGLDFFSWDLHN